MKKIVSYPHTPLTKKGHKAALNLGKRLFKEKLKIDAIYCSTLYRTLQTMEEILKANLESDHNKIILTDLIKEINRKEYEGKDSDEYYVAKQAYRLEVDDFRCKGGESENDVGKRAEKMLEEIKASKDESIMLITHGHFINQFLKKLKLESRGHLWGAGLSLIEIDGDNAKIIFWDDHKHITV